MVHRAGRFRPIAKIGVLVTAVVIVASIIKSVVSPGPPKLCVYPCVKPPSGPSLPTADTYSNSHYGFSFQYPAGGAKVAVSGDQVVGLQYTLRSGGFAGEALVGASSSAASAQQLIQQEAAALGGEGITNVQTTGPLNGAEIGFISGTGELLSGVYTDTVGNQDPVSIGIIAVTHGTAVVYFEGISVAASAKSTPPVFPAFDSILDHWTWSTS
jgi:hypothetical protein